MFQAALFDLEGVIADTTVYHLDTWQRSALPGAKPGGPSFQQTEKGEIRIE
ncbi:hypothetical protein [Lactobacillus sp. 23-2]|jgi:beta-phosphoglucomutase-like phosphatase (HAD superfamily)|uniref:hypothetical protein n=1 Tax=Lactobacillus TaxID=1578 RepID=UPI003833D628